MKKEQIDTNSLAHTKWNCKYHIHILVSIPPKMSISGFMGHLKGKSALLIFQKWGNMKFAY